ncbi:Rrf2 family transcriptional regulator [Mycoplasma seminis]|uniref:Rrf2 family transcriptional regulator n=1 Tax=Mycoplasma seminis TaxID=512749 RepID=A0ABY9HAV6_9MOLU|nr:Rrf2 family transcriptional regulator [Mycoplasma seminis]WLP85334.1 Rrf2 family transcriptional regulator [Mycoplasma seminis]
MKNNTYKKQNNKYCFSDFMSLIHILVILGHKKIPLTSKQIAANANINPVKVRSILQALKPTGWIETTHGIKGGYSLNIELNKIQLHQLLEVLDLALVSNSWASGFADSECIISRNIASVQQDLINSLNNAISEELKKINLEEIEQKIIKKEQDE